MDNREMKQQVSVLYESGQMAHYSSLAAFLATLTAADLTTALAAVLKLDRERLAHTIMALQAAALMENQGSKDKR